MGLCCRSDWNAYVFHALLFPRTSRPSISIERKNYCIQFLAQFTWLFLSTLSSALTVFGCSYAAHWLLASPPSAVG